ncbi:ATP-binding protein [Nocardioides pyridinolyticus]
MIFSGSAPDDPEDEQWFARRTAGYVLKDQLNTLVDTLVTVASPPAEGAWSLSLPRDLAGLAIARAQVRQQLHEWSLPKLVDPVVMIASELAGNAVEHARSGFDLRLEIRGGRVLRIVVLDHGQGNPDLHPFDIGAERGRGLHLVSQLAQAWGVEPVEDNGKNVWAELSID